MSSPRLFIRCALVALAIASLAGCASPPPPAPSHLLKFDLSASEARDYPGQSYFCYLHKADTGC